MSGKDRLIYLPLGGSGEVGMNAYVYGYGRPGKERLILVDIGVTFPDMDTTPGVDLIFPDMKWLADNADRLEAIFITHAHEDHVGALGHLWPRLKAPVFCRNFTARIAKHKMEDQGQDANQITTVAPMPEMVEAGPFTVQFMPVSHSLPEASGLIIDTPAGRIVHTGDFKMDMAPGVGEPFDPDLMAAIGDSGVKALVCDSTNVFNSHPGRSESSLPDALGALIGNAKGMVVATTFASNVARLRTLAQVAHANGRSVCLLGRAMQRMTKTATDAGLLRDMPPTVSPEQARDIPRENLMLIVTGSQGERRAASAQLARGVYMGLSMKPGDTFLFSSMTIPGNERGVINIINAYSEMEVDVISADPAYHVSGHANRPDLEQMHALMRPQMLIPMHGEHRMLREHTKIALAKGLKAAVVTNGTMVDLSGDAPRVVEHVETGRVYLDGTRLVGAMDGVIRDRIRMALGGHVLVTLIIDEAGQPLGDAWAEIMGLSKTGRGGRDLIDTLEEELATFLQRADRKLMANDDKLNEAMRRVVRQVTMEELGKKAEVTVVISRLSDE